jgi:hypothetical protein
MFIESKISRSRVGIGITIIRTTAIMAITIIKSVDLLIAGPNPAWFMVLVAIYSLPPISG